MSRRIKPALPAKRAGLPLKTPYASLGEGVPPRERLAKWLREVKQGDPQPMTVKEFDQFLAEPSDWPEEDLDEFLAWLHRSRREGRY